MSKRTLSEMPLIEEIMESPHELDFIRKRLTGLFKCKGIDNDTQLAVLELILCLANEIADLKDKVSK